MSWGRDVIPAGWDAVEVPPSVQEPHCPKCGSRMHSAPTYVHPVRSRLSYGCGITGLDCPRGEHLHRACYTCRYIQWEPCMDNRWGSNGS